ncbi:MAG: rod shape-determining protein MreC [Peptococcaceae bacterium]|nr:rod shape-determining protein MreC [Peptococcaceae bacterium]
MFRRKWVRNLLVVAAMIAVFLTLAVNTVQPRENLTFVEKGLRIAASPFQYGFKAINDSVSGFFAYFTEKEALQQENEALKQQLSQRNNELTQMDEISMENIRLRELLNYKEETRGQYQLQLAGIIAENNTNLQHTITLDKGSNDGVVTGMTVLNHWGLIGRITAVLPDSSEVMLLPDRESAIGARVRSTREVIGVVEGDGSGSSSLQMIHLPHDADLYVGDSLTTSGLDGVFPGGIQIGEVTAIEYSANGLTKTATVKPYVNFSRLEEVFVLMNSGGGAAQ